jgi:hypothetical protein
MEYQEFRKQYEEQHPASVPVEEAYIGEYPRWVTWAVGAMFVAAAFFSGIHTVPVAYRTIEQFGVAEWLRQAGGVSAFLFIELAVLVSAYMLVKRRSVVMLVILAIAICVAMGANLYSVSEAFLPNQSDVFPRVIAIMFGLVAPLMAALAGGVFVWLHHAERVAEARVKAAFKELSVAWDKEIERVYKKLYPVEGQGVSRKTMKSREENKPRVKLHEVAKIIHENGDANISVNEMMMKYNISMGSTSKVREILKQQGKGYTNGHSTDGDQPLQ